MEKTSALSLTVLALDVLLLAFLPGRTCAGQMSVEQVQRRVEQVQRRADRMQTLAAPKQIRATGRQSLSPGHRQILERARRSGTQSRHQNRVHRPYRPWRRVARAKRVKLTTPLPELQSG